MRVSFILLGLLVASMIFMKPAVEYFMGFSENKYEQPAQVQHVVEVSPEEELQTDEEAPDEETSDGSTSDEAIEETIIPNLPGEGITEMENETETVKENPFAEEDLKNYVPPAE